MIDDRTPPRAKVRGGVLASQARKHLGLALAATPPRGRAHPLGGPAGSPRSRLDRCQRLQAARGARFGSADDPRPEPRRRRAPTHRCVRCHTRYCNATCQHAHWANGHKKKCKKIARGGAGRRRIEGGSRRRRGYDVDDPLCRRGYDAGVRGSLPRRGNDADRPWIVSSLRCGSTVRRVVAVATTWTVLRVVAAATTRIVRASLASPRL